MLDAAIKRRLYIVSASTIQFRDREFEKFYIYLSLEIGTWRWVQKLFDCLAPLLALSNMVSALHALQINKSHFEFTKTLNSWSISSR